MRTSIFSMICSMAIAALASGAHAQSDSTLVGARPGAAGALRTVQVTATIAAIDPATREVTLKRPDGREVSLVAGDNVRNFAQMKVGDQVNVEYVQALTLKLESGGGSPVARTEEAAGERSNPGERPAGSVGRTVTVVADVVAIDAATKTVTLKGPHRTVDLTVDDPEQFKRVNVGDQVRATYTEALAIEVQPASK